jgi:cytochrome c
MKNIVFIIVLLTFLSCKKEIQKPETVVAEAPSLELGKTLFETNNCVACHQAADKTVGPSMEQMANIYKKEKANMSDFLRGNSGPIVDPTQYETMKVNLELTKSMTDEELQSIEIYVLSFAK